MSDLKKIISFDVKGKPPKKSNWDTDDTYLVIKFREEALKARTNAGLSDCFRKSVKLNLIVYAPNTTEINYIQTGDDDPKKYVGDLDSLVAGICEYLQPAPNNPELDFGHFDGKNEIGPKVALIIENDSQIAEINAKKLHDETLHYHVEIEPL